ncbi:1730_t:CDS:2, partial [Acaulospora colombiana]
MQSAPSPQEKPQLTSNKIGTYNAAVLAQRHGVPFVVCCPVSTLDLEVADGSAIPIEHRPAIEACLVRGRVVGATEGAIASAEPAQAIVQITPDLDLEGGGVYNPSFDVTPAELISAVVTEKGVAQRPASAATINITEKYSMSFSEVTLTFSDLMRVSSLRTSTNKSVSSKVKGPK